MEKLHMVLRLKTPYGVSMVSPIAMRRRPGQATLAKKFQFRPHCSIREMQLPPVLPLPMKEPLAMPDTDRYQFKSSFLF